ncbi:hypothetical protein CLNEO_18830 [Anaerotignum neopropionicum]|uniref:Transposase n=1 Tax=Anaerotignum neopropionicum TaxID=36847 RepID=A0A136WEC9_9FIRM|nr:hypothetical protein [Anaerotignum neopropionicum]KXL52860.1 hypothetical protein CLNEO_18830 [Anaerotignum neopropionicum]
MLKETPYSGEFKQTVIVTMREENLTFKETTNISSTNVCSD